MNAFEDVITHATYTFYTNPKWTGLLQSLNDWAAKHEGFDFKKSNTNTISTTFRNLTVNFYTSTKCITITNSHGSRDDMTQTATDFKLWLQNTMDYSHDIDEELTEILTGKADFQLTKTKHTQSPSSEQMSMTQQKTKQPTSELLEQDLLIILDKLYMNNIQKKALVPDLTSVYSVRLEHVPRIWKEITNEIKDKGSFAGFQIWWQDYIKIYLTNQKSSAIKWFRENVPKMHHLIQTKMEKTMKKQAPDTTISSIPELEQTNTPNRSMSLSLGTKLASEMANEETIKELTKALEEAKKAHDNLAIKTEANTKAIEELVRNKFNPLNIPDVAETEKRLNKLESAATSFTESQHKAERKENRLIPKLKFTSKDKEQIESILRTKLPTLHDRVREIQEQVNEVEHLKDDFRIHEIIREYLALNPTKTVRAPQARAQGGGKGRGKGTSNREDLRESKAPPRQFH